MHSLSALKGSSARLNYPPNSSNTPARLACPGCSAFLAAARRTRSEGYNVACRAVNEPTSTSSSSSNAGNLPPLDDPVAMVQWGGMLASPQRMVSGFLAATVIALGGNLGGVTSALLALDGGNVAHTLHLDVLVPVNGLKSYLDGARGFEFQYPSDWLADQTLLYRAVERAEADRGLDPGPLRPRPVRRDVLEPTAAFGPPGSSGEENISIIVAPIMPGFQLSTLGTPHEAAKFLVFQKFAPQGSKRTGQLIAADSRTDESGQLYYTMEFTIQGPTWLRHNLSIFTARDDSLYTLNVQCPGAKWEKDQQVLKKSAASFRVLPR